jgi:hypothetical protein
VVAWEVAEVESAEIAAELVQRDCFNARYQRTKGFGDHQLRPLQQPVTLLTNKGNAMRGARLDSQQKEMGVL